MLTFRNHMQIYEYIQSVLLNSKEHESMVQYLQ